MGRLEKSLAPIKILPMGGGGGWYWRQETIWNGVSTTLQLVVAHKDTGQQAYITFL